MRVPDWPERLAEYIESRRAEPFAYGTHDCCKFAAGAVQTMTGVDPSVAWSYRNEIGARRLMVEAGGLDALVTRALGEPVHASRAGRGDVVLAELENGPTVGVCIGLDCVFPSDVGITFRPRHFIGLAWKVT